MVVPGSNAPLPGEPPTEQSGGSQHPSTLLRVPFEVWQGALSLPNGQKP